MKKSTHPFTVSAILFTVYPFLIVLISFLLVAAESKNTEDFYTYLSYFSIQPLLKECLPVLLLGIILFFRRVNILLPVCLAVITFFDLAPFIYNVKELITYYKEYSLINYISLFVSLLNIMALLSVSALAFLTVYDKTGTHKLFGYSKWAVIINAVYGVCLLAYSVYDSLTGINLLIFKEYTLSAIIGFGGALLVNGIMIAGYILLARGLIKVADINRENRPLPTLEEFEAFT